MRELNNEKVDIIHWSPNIDEFVAEALKPAELREIEVHKEEKRIQVWVLKTSSPSPSASAAKRPPRLAPDRLAN